MVLLRHPFLSVCTLAYLGFVAWMTLTPAPYDQRAAGLIWRGLNFFSRHQSTEWITFGVVEFLANIAMFVPVGVFLVLLFGRRQWWIAILFGILLSCAIEIAQLLWLPTRFPDVRDVISNGSGTIIGVMIAELITWPKAYRMRQAQKLAASHEAELRYARSA
jgi:glycopeptide antibiotics resistance protein